MHILAIETSCDETSAAVVVDGRKVLSNSIRSSVDQHQQYGGVVPEIAAREHVRVMIPVIDSALKDARCDWDQIDAIAVTVSPGLIGSLLVGINTARTLAKLKNKPLIEVNHIYGHIYSNWLLDKDFFDEPKFPIVVLTVSGGHNDIMLLRGHHDFELIGESIDDAAGEAFDKVAKILKLGYPGGPIISQIALEGDSKVFSFPRSWLSDNYDFSFSGLKTSVLYTVQKMGKLSRQDKANIAASFQEAVCDVLATKLVKAAEKYDVSEVHLAGGVSANTRLRECIQSKLEGKGLVFRCPGNFQYCTDNAAMIGAAGYFSQVS